MAASQLPDTRAGGGIQDHLLLRVSAALLALAAPILVRRVVRRVTT